MGLLADIHSDLERGTLRLIREYRDRLFAEAVRLCGNHSDADDLVSRALVKGLANIDKYQKDNNLYGWLKTVMVNLHRDDLRHPVLRNTMPVDPSTIEAYSEADKRADEQLLENSDSEALKLAIERLDPEYKKMIVLHYFAEMPVKNIATCFKIPLGTVLWRLNVARKMLARDLAPKLGKRSVVITILILLTVGALFGAWRAGFVDWLLERENNGTSEQMEVQAMNKNESGSLMLMPRASVAVMGMTALVLSAYADVFVGYGEYAAHPVPLGGTETLSASTVISSGGSWNKTGEGTLNVNESSLTTVPDAELGIRSGVLRLSLDGATGSRPVPELPLEISACAQLWLDAALFDSKPQLFPGASSNDNTYVDRWYDARETNVASPTFLSVGANVCTNYGACSPQIARVDGKRCVYFGGLGSGRYMSFLSQDGTTISTKDASVKNVAHVFAVHAIDKSWGFLFGSFAGSSFVIGSYSSADASLHGTYWASSWLGDLMSGRTYIDGALVDGARLHVKKGLQLMDVDMINKSGQIDALYCDRGYFSASEKYRVGGDYLCELLVFTNRLTESQRLQVSDYLLKKWDIRSLGVSMEVSENASLQVSSNASKTRAVRLTGRGMVEKTGAQSVDFSSAKSMPFGGAVKLEEGTANVAADIPLALASGSVVTAVKTENGLNGVCLTTGQPSDVLVKDGDGTVVIGEIPEGVKKISVNAGRLSVRERPLDLLEGANDLDVSITNASFEDWDADKAVWGYAVTGGAVSQGWKCSNAYLLDYEGWGWEEKGIDGATRNLWRFDQHPPAGKRMLGIRKNGSAQTDVDIVMPGEYELSFAMHGRNSNSYRGSGLAIALEGRSVGETNFFNQVTFLECNRFRYHKLRTLVRKPGTYSLKFTGLLSSDEADNVQLIDDVRLVRMPGCRAYEWGIPGGDFEATVFNKAKITALSTDHVQAGWELVQNGLADIGVALTSQLMPSVNHNNSRAPRGGQVLLNFRARGNNTSVCTSFTPPAGTYCLMCQAAANGNNFGTLDAEITIDGKTLSLGSNCPRTKMFQTVTWPTAFTVADGSSVSLRLTYRINRSSTASDADGGLYVDDFVLASTDHPQLNYIMNGSFEDDLSWRFGSGAYRYNYVSGAANYGSCFDDGDVGVLLGKTGTFSQTLTLPNAGLYRYSFNGKQRVGQGESSYKALPMRLLVMREDETYSVEVGSHIVGGLEFAGYSGLFSVPCAGTYRLEFVGVGADDHANACIDSVTVNPVPTENASMQIDPGLEISVQNGAKLDLSFIGTNKVSALRLGNKFVSGVVNAQTYPDYLSGSGNLDAPKRGLVISVW